jgi:hypothetical protein
MLINMEQMYCTDEHVCNRSKVNIMHDVTRWIELPQNSVTWLWVLKQLHINACKTNTYGVDKMTETLKN